MIANLLLFGATGDLAGRYLFPALAQLHAVGHLPEQFRLVGAASRGWDHGTFRDHVEDRLREHAADVPAASQRALLDALRYHRVDLTEASSVAAVVGDMASAAPARAPIAAYLALPPNLFPPTVAALGDAGMPEGSRIVVEKPFGDDQASARALNELLARAMPNAGAEGVFRVDHVLGMATVHNMVGLRMFDPVVNAVWNSTHISQVEVLWEETLALEGRAGYYDRAGALKDVMQNHMIQLLCLVAMETRVEMDAHELQQAKIDVLQSVRPLGSDAIASNTQRGRYTTGQLASAEGRGRAVPAYVDEDGVDPERRTETFAEVVVRLDTPRWRGTRFVLRAGKALTERRKGIHVTFRPMGAAGAAASDIWIGIDGPDDLDLRLTGGTGGLPPQPRPLAVTANPADRELPAYSRVLLDVLQGGSGLSVGRYEAEAAWRIMSPVVDAWAADAVPLLDYPAGSAGLPPLPSTAQPTAPSPTPDRRSKQ